MDLKKIISRKIDDPTYIFDPTLKLSQKIVVSQYEAESLVDLDSKN